MSVVVAALYHFARLPEPEAVRGPLLAVCRAGGVMGTLLLAREGVNGTIAGPRAGVDAVLAAIRRVPGLAALECKESTASAMPFLRMKVRVKAEIVTMGAPDVDPTAAVGAYVEPRDWDALCAREDVVVIDTRNDYEVAIGTFRGAVDPGTARFRDFPDWWAQNGARFANRKVAMFCTGGIRCEKATNWLLGQGVREVYHLRGGILKYLEEVPPEDSSWQGDCFVFDGRVSVGHGLAEGGHALCHACRRPVTAQDRTRPEYERGVSCHQCLDDYDDARRERFRERQRQVDLAAARGKRHIGGA